MINRIQESFSAKIILLVTSSVLLTSLVVGIATTRSTRAFLTEKTSEKFPSVLTGSQSRVRIWYNDQFSVLAELSRSEILKANLRRYLSDEEPSDAIVEIRKYTELINRQFPYFKTIACTDVSGQVIASSSEMTIDGLDALRMEVAEATDAPSTSPFYGYPSNPYQWFLQPIESRGEITAWMVASVGAEMLTEMLDDIHTGAGGDIYVVDEHGRFVTQPRLASVPRYGQQAMQVPTRQTGPPVVEKRTNYDGREVFLSMTHIEERNWWVVYEEDYNIAMAPVHAAQRRMWVAVFLICIIAVLVALRIAQSILAPINKLSVAARRINEGLVGVRVAPVPNDEIGMLIETFNEMAQKIAVSNAELNYKNKVLNTKNDELEDVNTRLEELSITDGLTGLFNHRHFWNLLNTELSRVGLYQGELALVLVDLDDFKQVNDQFGHAVGDELLKRVARIMKENVRDTDICARYGGEEFAVLLPDTNQKGVKSVSEKLRNSVEALRFKVPETDIAISVTISVGVSVFRGNRREFFNAADRALYRSKADGKNRVNLAPIE